MYGCARSAEEAAAQEQQAADGDDDADDNDDADDEGGRGGGAAERTLAPRAVSVVRLDTGCCPPACLCALLFGWPVPRQRSATFANFRELDSRSIESSPFVLSPFALRGSTERRRARE